MTGLVTTASGAERLTATPELIFLLKTVLSDAGTLGIRPHMLNALRGELDALGGVEKPAATLDPTQPWVPGPELIWSPEMVRKDGKKLSAYAFYRERFEPLPRNEMPFAHQVRQHEATRAFYDSLCVYLSRNRARGIQPSSIAQLFPVTDEARGGHFYRKKA